ncbi:MAG TPA: UDP-2,3-diacylglucosamine diphosphatase [Woeseiaceae bacterium]|nr:UDP-2,3-diacylglucosamine diphosphatase [Woeseiaceae bacterium]
MTTLFISDLHLEADRPGIGEQFLSFLDTEAATADALYILGDLFEYWIGDDDPDPYYASMKEAISGLTDRGVPVYFMHGNRDFMIGESFAAETGVQLLNDPAPVNIYGTPVLLSHGDALCTDDVKYQEVRRMTRNPAWQTAMLGKPVAERRAIAEQARADSMAHGGAIDLTISDVNQAAVEALLRSQDVRTLLHGHTHRPAVHEFPLDGRPAMRIVLGDWYEQGSVVRWDEDGPELSVLQR